MKARRRKIETSSDQGTGGQLLALSLFIMLLAFFIVLNAISGFEQKKVNPVLDSLEMAFASKISQKGNEQPSVARSEEKDMGEGDTLDRMAALFKSQIPDYDEKIDKRSGTMFVRLRWSDFEAAVLTMGTASAEAKAKDDISKDRDYFLSALLALMANEKAGEPLRMDIALLLGDNPAALQNKEPAKMTKIAQSLARVAQKIEATGLKKRYLGISVKKGTPDMVEIFFRPHIPFNPVIEGQAYE